LDASPIIFGQIDGWKLTVLIRTLGTPAKSAGDPPDVDGFPAGPVNGGRIFALDAGRWSA
jgi:hypothetical protein